MKKFLKLLVPVLLIAVLAVVLSFALTAEEANVLYVADEARGTGDGSSPENALGNSDTYADLFNSTVASETNLAFKESALYRAINQLKTTGGKIVLVGPTSVECCETATVGTTTTSDKSTRTSPSECKMPAGTGAITITSVDGANDYRNSGAKLILSQKEYVGTDLCLGTPTTFENLNIEYYQRKNSPTGSTWYKNSFMIICNGKATTFGEGLDVKSFDGDGNADADVTHLPTIIGGHRFSKLTANVSVTIKSGSWARVIAGGHGMSAANSGAITGNVTLVVDGGNIGTILGNGCDFSSRKFASVSGDLTITVNGGTVGNAIGDVTGQNTGSYGTFTYKRGTIAKANISKFATTTPTGYFTVTYSGATISGKSSPANYIEDNQVTITANAAPAGKYFSGWEATGVTLADDKANPLTFTMPEGNVTLTPKYTDKHTLTYTSATIQDKTSPAEYAAGESVTITAAAAPQDKVFDKWTVTGISLTTAQLATNPLTFDMPAADVTFTATYKWENEVSVTVDGGTISGKSENPAAIDPDTSVTVTANAAAAGKYFAGWTVEGVTIPEQDKANTSVTFTMPTTNVTLTANYKNYYTLTLTGGNKTAPASELTELKEDDTVTVTAAPEAGESFVKWEAEGVTGITLTNSTVTFTMPAGNVTLTAKYTKTIYVADEARGTGDGSSPENAIGNSDTYAEKFASDLQAVANTAYKESALYRAFDALKTTGGKIVLVGETSIECCETGKKSATEETVSDKSTRQAPSEANYPANAEPITITSVDGATDYRTQGAKLVLSQETFVATALCLKGETVWENLDIEYKQAESYPNGSWYQKNFLIECNGKNTVFGEGLNVTSTDGVNFPSIIGGHRYSKVSGNTNVTIKSGTWSMVFVGGHGMSAANNGEVTGNATLTVDGGKIGTIYGNSSVIRKVGIVDGNLTVTINGGTVGEAIGKVNGEETETQGTITYERGTIAKANISKFETTTATGYYTVTYTDGTITGKSSPADYIEGNQVTITANAAPAGKEFSVWTVKGITLEAAQLSNSTLTFTMPEGNVELTANYKSNTQKGVSVTGGVISGGTETYKNYEPGTAVSVTVGSAPEGKYFSSWTATGMTITPEQAASETLSFTMPDSDVTLTATYKDFVTLTLTGGTMTSPASELTELKEGDTVTVTAAPEAGENFVKWEAEGVTGITLTNSTVTFTMPAGNVTLTAKYSKVVYISSDGMGDGSSPANAMGNDEEYDPADAANRTKNVFVKAMNSLSKTGGTIVVVGEVRIDIADAIRKTPAELQAPTTKEVTAENITITSKFGGVDYANTNGAKIVLDQSTNSAVNLYIRACTTWENITIENKNGVGDKYWYAPSTCIIEFTGNKTVIGEGVNCVLGEGSTLYPDLMAGQRYSNVSSADLTIKSGTWNRVFCAGFGQGASNPGKVTGNATLTVEGGKIAKILGNSSDLSNRNFGAVDGNLTVTINGGEVGEAVGDVSGQNGGALGTITYKRGTIAKANISKFATTNATGYYTVTYTDATIQGKSSPADYVEGNQVTITANAAPAGKEFSVWTVKGITLEAAQLSNSTLTFTMPEGNVELTANYKSNTERGVSVTDGVISGGTETYKNYEPGTTVTVVANSAPEGKYFAGWTATGVTLTPSQTSNATLSFTMPTSNVTLTANYKKYVSLTVSGGTMTSPASELTELKAGDTVTVVAAPGAGESFSKWEATEVTGVVLTNSTITFTMPDADVTLTAKFVKTIYVADVARGTGDGSSPENAIGNSDSYAEKFASTDASVATTAYKESALYRAFNAIKENGGKIVLVGETSIECCDSGETVKGNGVSDKSTRAAPAEATYPANKELITITSVDGTTDYRTQGAKLVLSQETFVSTSLCLQGETVWENLDIEYKQASEYPSGAWYQKNFLIQCKGNTTVFGEGLNITSTDGVNFPSIIGGHRYSKVDGNTNVTIKSGTWSMVFVGGHGMSEANNGEVTGNATLTVDGGKIGTIYGNSSAIRKTATVGGTLTVTINGGTVEKAIGKVNGGEGETQGTINYKRGTVAKSAISNFATLNASGYYTLTFTDATIQGKSSPANYVEGNSVTITANSAPAGKEFVKWTAEGLELTDKQATSTTMTFTMPESNVVIKANYKSNTAKAVNIVDGVISGTQDSYGNFEPNSTVSVTANAAPEGKYFTGWTAEGVVLTPAQSASATLTFTMPSNEVTLTAVYSDYLTFKVEKGTIVGSTETTINVKAGESITIKANLAANEKFSRWSVNEGELNGAVLTNSTLTFNMPEKNLTLTALASKTIYVADEAKGTGDGSSPENALGNSEEYAKKFASLESYTNDKGTEAAVASEAVKESALYRAFQALNGYDGKIVVVGELSIECCDSAFTNGAPDFATRTSPAEYTLPKNTETITITSVDGNKDYRLSGAKLVLDQSTYVSTNLCIKGETVWENLNIEYNPGENNISTWYGPNASTASNPTFMIECSGYKTVFGNGLTVTSTDGKSLPSIIGGHRYSAVSSGTNVTINSGSWDMVIAGSHGMSEANPGVVNGDAVLVVNGGSINTIFGNSSETRKTASVSGDIKITINGGSVGRAVGDVAGSGQKGEITYKAGTISSLNIANFKDSGSVGSAKFIAENATVEGAVSGTDVPSGTHIKATANPAPSGMKFYKWEVTGVNGLILTNATIEFDMLDMNVQIKATYRNENAFDIVVNNGTIKGGDVSYLMEKDTVTVTANAAKTGKIFEKWDVKGITLADPTAKTVTFTMPANNVTLTAVYRDAVKYTLTVADNTVIEGYNGKSASIYEGETVVLTAKIGDDYKVKAWDTSVQVKESTSTDDTFTFEMPGANLSVTYTAIDMFKGLPVVYVASNGTGDGSSPDKPLGNDKTYEKSVEAGDTSAYKNNALYLAVEKIKATGGTVVIVGEVVIDSAEAFRNSPAEFQLPKDVKGPVKLTSYYGGVNFAEMKDDNNPDYTGAKLVIDQSNLSGLAINMPIETVWSNLTIEYIPGLEGEWYGPASAEKSNPTTLIQFSGAKALIGENVKVISTDGKSYPSLVAGNRYTKVESTNLTVKSGTWDMVFAGGHSMNETNNGAVTGDAKLVVDGATINKIYGVSSGIRQFGMIFGKLEVIIKSGTVKKAFGAVKDGETYGSIIYNSESINQFKIKGFETMNPAKGDPSISVTNGNIEGVGTAATLKVGTAVKVVADTPAEGMRFYKWEITGIDEDIDLKLNAKKTTLEFEMPEADLTFKALYKDKNAGYEVNVTGGSIAGYTADLVEIKAGTNVTVIADAPEAGMRFKCWEMLGSDEPMSTCSKVSFVMPSDDVILTAVYETDPFASLPVIYISANGEGDGSAPDKPLGNKSSYKAKLDAEDQTALKDNVFYLAFEQLAKTGGTIVLVGDVAIESADAKRNAPAEFTLPKVTGPVKITSVYDGVDYRDSAKLIIDQTNWESVNLAFQCETWWENLNMHYKPGSTGEWYGGKSKNYPNETTFLEFYGNTTVIGEGVNVTSEDGKCFPTLIAGHRYAKVSTTNLTVKSGTWDMVFAGGHGMTETNNGTVNGDAYLLIDGSDVAINTIYGVSSAARPTAEIKGKLYVKINLGKVNKAYGAVAEGKEYGTIVYNENSISAANIIGFEKVTAFGSIATASADGTSAQTGSMFVYAIVGAAVALAAAVLVLNKKKIKD